MGELSDISADLSTDDYLREARRVRVRFAGQPWEMHRRLQELGSRRDRALSGDTKRDAEQAAPRAVVRRRETPTTPVRVAKVHAIKKERAGVLGVGSPAAEIFATEVEGAMEAGMLRYTARERLLVRAGELGIGRFDANLVIASVVHAKGARGRPERSVAGWVLLLGAVASGVAGVGMMWVIGL